MTPPLAGWLAVCGLHQEARIWGGRAVIGGGRADRLAANIDAAIAAARPVGLVSFGLAGALSPTLAVGDGVVGDAVITDSERFACDPATAAATAATLGLPILGVFGADRVVADLAGKRALSGSAAVVDMESQVAARAAARHGLPLAVLRVVSDAAHDVLPPAAVAGFGADGGVDVLAVIFALARDPRQLPGLLRMARNSGVAFAALKRVAPRVRART